jgi:hypothetical protein
MLQIIKSTEQMSHVSDTMPETFHFHFDIEYLTCAMLHSSWKADM